MAKKKAVDKLQFVLVSSYENEDDFGCDPCGYYLELDGVVLVSYGDYYHDKGRDKCEGFMDGYSTALCKTYEVKYVDVADFEM